MGCDIHTKTFVFSNVENKMIPLDSALEDVSGWERFPAIVGDRDYSLFGVLGNSARSYYPEMSGLNRGCPPFAENTTIGKMIMDSDYHTHRWSDAKNLKKNLLEYKECLEDFNKYYEKYGTPERMMLLSGDDAADEVDVAKTEWKEENKYLIDSIENMIDKITAVETFVFDYSYIGLDKNQIVFAFWMDS